jgi:hypothetical protein
MRRIPETTLTRDECLRRAMELDWLADQCPRPEAGAECWAQARYWRSLALRARPRLDGQRA